MEFSNQEPIDLKDGKKRIQIKDCHAFGPQFKNLTENSIHELVDPPEDYKQGDRGFWVQGVGEPVLVLHSELTEL